MEHQNILNIFNNAFDLGNEILKKDNFFQKIDKKPNEIIFKFGDKPTLKFDIHLRKSIKDNTFQIFKIRHVDYQLDLIALFNENSNPKSFVSFNPNISMSEIIIELLRETTEKYKKQFNL